MVKLKASFSWSQHEVKVKRDEYDGQTEFHESKLSTGAGVLTYFHVSILILKKYRTKIKKAEKTHQVGKESRPVHSRSFSSYSQ